MNKFTTTEDIVYNNKTKKEIIIGHISDIHFSTNTSSKMLDKLKDNLFNLKPDYIMITGDTLDVPSITDNKEKIKELISFLTSLGKKTKVLISIGNHDVLSNDNFNFFNELNDINNVYVLNNNYYQDEFIYVSGFTLSHDYYYNITKKESIFKNHQKSIDL